MFDWVLYVRLELLIIQELFKLHRSIKYLFRSFVQDMRHSSVETLIVGLILFALCFHSMKFVKLAIVPNFFKRCHTFSLYCLSTCL